MSKKKSKKIIKLISTKSSHFYTKIRSNKSKLKKISLIKFDPIIKKHVLYNESKIN